MHSYIVCQAPNKCISLLVDTNRYVDLDYIAHGPNIYHLACFYEKYLYVSAKTVTLPHIDIYKINLTDFSLVLHVVHKVSSEYNCPEYMFTTFSGDINLLYSSTMGFPKIRIRFKCVIYGAKTLECIASENKDGASSPGFIEFSTVQDGNLYIVDENGLLYTYSHNKQRVIRLESIICVTEVVPYAARICGKYISIGESGTECRVSTEDPYYPLGYYPIWDSLHKEYPGPFIMPLSHADKVYMVRARDGNVVISNLITKALMLVNANNGSVTTLDLPAYSILSDSYIC